MSRSAFQRRRRNEFRAPPTSHYGCAAFTLIELLIVIAIVALLAALTVPALSRAKSSAHRARCVNHLRQLGLAAQMYWDDNEGRAFRWRGAVANGGRIFWFGWMEDGIEGTRRFDATQGALFPYLSGRGVDVCPAFTYNSSRVKLKATGASYGYGYNLSLSVPLNDPAVNISHISRLSELVVMADAAQVNTFQAPASPERPMLEEFYYLSTNEPTVHFRHQQKANAVFADGHVSGEKPARSSLDEALPGEVIGRLETRLLILQ